ncbi:MAG TPA: hypothetical protein VF590_24810 [Isosphaeraceae bacterium]
MSGSTKPEQPMTDRQVYNVITDTVAGPNVRLRDNLYQGLVILICVLIGAPIGYSRASGTDLGAGIGTGLGIAGGMIVGVLTSGTFLMLYRGIRHVRGRHD